MVRSDPKDDQKITEFSDIDVPIEGDEQKTKINEGSKSKEMEIDAPFSDDKSDSLAMSQFEPEYFSHAIISPYRTEDIPIAEKTYSTLSSEVTFKKNQSVFKDWKEDTDTKLKGCCDHDFELWKLDKFAAASDEQD